MLRQNYEIPEITITLFIDEDVITASNLQVTTEDDGPIELPFVPIKPKYY